MKLTFKMIKYFSKDIEILYSKINQFNMKFKKYLFMIILFFKFSGLFYYFKMNIKFWEKLKYYIQ